MSAAEMRVATATAMAGMVAVMDELEQKYVALVERISGYPMTETARARILAEIEAIYRAERGAGRAAPTGSPPAA